MRCNTLSDVENTDTPTEQSVRIARFFNWGSAELVPLLSGAATHGGIHIQVAVEDAGNKIGRVHVTECWKEVPVKPFPGVLRRNGVVQDG